MIIMHVKCVTFKVGSTASRFGKKFLKASLCVGSTLDARGPRNAWQERNIIDVHFNNPNTQTESAAFSVNLLFI